MKTLFNVFVVFTVALGLSACGGKGGVNDSGVEANGNCSGSAVGDFESSSKDTNNAVRTGMEKGRAGDVAGAKSKFIEAYEACTRFEKKYGATFTCKNPNDTRQILDATVRGAECERKVKPLTNI